MKISADEFREQYLPPLREEFHKKTQQYLIEHREAIVAKIKKRVINYFNYIKQIQEKVPIEVGEVQISILHSSIMLNKPQMAITSYSEGGVLGKEIMTVKYEAAWLFTYWEEYHNAIKAKIEELLATNYIQEEAILQMQRESVMFLIYTVYALTKYTFTEIDKTEEFMNIMAADNFRISVGSYRDWSRTLFMKTDKKDIFFNVADRPLIYSLFTGAVYNRKEFKNLDLSYCRFEECEFVHCSFKDCVLNDTIFSKCRFYYCDFEHVSFYGTTMKDVTIKKVNFNNTRWKFEADMEDYKNVYEIFKPAQISESVLEYLTFNSSDLSDLIINNCEYKDNHQEDCLGNLEIFAEVTV